MLNGTIPLPTQFKRNGYKTLAAGKIFHKGTSDVKGYDYWHEARPKYKWPPRLAGRGHGYQGAAGGHFHPFPPDGGAIYQKYKKGVGGQSLCWGALEADDMPPAGMPDEQQLHGESPPLKAAEYSIGPRASRRCREADGAPFLCAFQGL